MNALENLFLTELADRYDAEEQLVGAAPRMAESATCKDLQKLLLSHLKETEGHVKMVRRIFESFGEEPTRRRCEGTAGLLRECEEIAADFKGSQAINATVVSAAQKIQHHEIASYGCLHEWAKLLGNTEASALLKEILIEEKVANKALIALARSQCNNEALGKGNAAVSCNEDKTRKPA